MPQVSRIHSALTSERVRPLEINRADIARHAHRELSMLGIHINDRDVRDMLNGIGLDSNDVGPNPSPLPGLLAQGSPTPLQFLQEWLPGFVRVITAARKADQLMGVATVGAWEDEEVIQGILENLGDAVPYTDNGNIPLASWQANYARRTVVRFELGFSVGLLEEARTARARIQTASEKRISVARSLEIARNRVAFYGYNNGANNTFGYLNEPNLLAALTAAPGASNDTKWATKTFLEITADIRRAMVTLQVQCQDNIDPETTPLKLALPTGLNQYMTVTSQYGNSVRQWLKENYPNVTIDTAPDLNEAVGGENVLYLYPESFDDGVSDDGGQVWMQAVPAKFFALGTEKRAKSYLEDSANATAGAMLKRPLLVVRMIGV
ncbi:major capsid family protein [Pectobacterium aroidearum]|uniref:major capsid family protein n=1 Tax=Pectobacterium aroidearum TaxID=1201031 RepID=UPI003315E340